MRSDNLIFKYVMGTWLQFVHTFALCSLKSYFQIRNGYLVAVCSREQEGHFKVGFVTIAFFFPGMFHSPIQPTVKQTMCRSSGKEVERNESWPTRRPDRLSGYRLLAARCAAREEANGVER